MVIQKFFFGLASHVSFLCTTCTALTCFRNIALILMLLNLFLGWEAGHRPGQVWRCTHQVKCATHCHPLENFAVYHNFIIIIINNELNNVCGQDCQIRTWILLWQNNVYTQNSHGWRQKATMSRQSSPLCICVLFYHMKD